MLEDAPQEISDAWKNLLALIDSTGFSPGYIESFKGGDALVMGAFVCRMGRTLSWRMEKDANGVFSIIVTEEVVVDGIPPEKRQKTEMVFMWRHGYFGWEEEKFNAPLSFANVHEQQDIDRASGYPIESNDLSDGGNQRLQGLIISFDHCTRSHRSSKVAPEEALDESIPSQILGAWTTVVIVLASYGISSAGAESIKNNDGIVIGWRIRCKKHELSWRVRCDDGNGGNYRVVVLERRFFARGERYVYAKMQQVELSFRLRGEDGFTWDVDVMGGKLIQATATSEQLRAQEAGEVPPCEYLDNRAAIKQIGQLVKDFREHTKD